MDSFQKDLKTQSSSKGQGIEANLAWSWAYDKWGREKEILNLSCKPLIEIHGSWLTCYYYFYHAFGIGSIVASSKSNSKYCIQLKNKAKASLAVHIKITKNVI